ncbi:hypothetical protein FDA94_31450 [Herbidospora galbida]|uniref:Uncharacterized protein n=1 Tax=Herbidospora galbida TaxID=2575442 RepID=A0A4U3M7S4_9ACTN|nr:hypothetical protein [Herbidospora galbida]TKK84044.1 hypothetical protein FDA94_31450 [Herbidospora galbida]
MDVPSAGTPVVCDMTTAPDTARQRLEEYRLLFDRALVGRERIGEAVRFRFRAEPGLREQIEDLAAREKACCAFFAFEVTTDGEQIVWDCAVSDDPAARAILDEFYDLPEHGFQDPDGLRARLEGEGLTFVGGPDSLLQRAEVIRST